MHGFFDVGLEFLDVLLVMRLGFRCVGVLEGVYCVYFLENSLAIGYHEVGVVYHGESFD